MEPGRDSPIVQPDYAPSGRSAPGANTCHLNGRSVIYITDVPGLVNYHDVGSRQSSDLNVGS